MSKRNLGQILRALPQLGVAEIASIMEKCQAELTRHGASDTEPARLYTKAEMLEAQRTARISQLEELRARQSNASQYPPATLEAIAAAQAQQLQLLKDGGGIVVTDRLPPDLYVSSQGVVAAVQAARQEVLDAIEPMEHALRGLTAAFGQIVGYAGCDDGPNTRGMIAQALEDFAASMQALDTAQRVIQANPLISVQRDEKVMALCIGLRDTATAYAAARKDTGLHQAALRAYIKKYKPELYRQLYAAIEESRKRGRKHGQVDPVNRSMTDALDAARRALGILEGRELQYGEIDAIRRQAVFTMENIRGLTKVDRDALAMLRTADRTYLSNLMKRDNSSPKLNSGDELSLETI